MGTGQAQWAVGMHNPDLQNQAAHKLSPIHCARATNVLGTMATSPVSVHAPTELEQCPEARQGTHSAGVFVRPPGCKQSTGTAPANWQASPSRKQSTGTACLGLPWPTSRQAPPKLPTVNYDCLALPWSGHKQPTGSSNSHATASPCAFTSLST